jgi:RNA polymerase sigma-70 factor (ECF subfamily)
MTVYPANMVLSIPGDWLPGFRAEQLVTDLVRMVRDSLSCSDTYRKTMPASLDLDDVRRSRSGDGDAYRRLIERHQQHVGRIMWRFSRDPRVHEELVQDVFVEAYLSLNTFHARAPFVHWLSRIATRVGYNYFRQLARHKQRQSFTLQDWDRLRDDSPDEMQPGEAAGLLHRLLAQLPPRDRIVLTLRYLEDCDVAETARRIGWTETMVKVQTWRARKKLRKLFEQTGREIKS